MIVAFGTYWSLEASRLDIWPIGASALIALVVFYILGGLLLIAALRLRERRESRYEGFAEDVVRRPGQLLCGSPAHRHRGGDDPRRLAQFAPLVLPPLTLAGVFWLARSWRAAAMEHSP